MFHKEMYVLTLCRETESCHVFKHCEEDVQVNKKWIKVRLTMLEKRNIKVKTLARIKGCIVHRIKLTHLNIIIRSNPVMDSVAPWSENENQLNKATYYSNCYWCDNKKVEQNYFDVIIRILGFQGNSSGRVNICCRYSRSWWGQCVNTERSKTHFGVNHWQRIWEEELRYKEQLDWSELHCQVGDWTNFEHKLR